MKYIFFIVFSMLIPSLASADANLASGDAWTVYATANGQTLHAIFDASKGIVSDASYLSLITFVSILAFIGYAVMATLDVQKIQGFIGVLVMISVVTGFAIRQKADVVIQDPFNGTVYVSQDVPAGIAIPISLISTVGHKVTEMLETYFSTPGPLKVSKTGTINMASSLIQDASRMSIQDSNLRGTLAAFSKDCILPSIASGWLSGSQITDAIQLFGTGGTLSQANPALLTTAYGQDQNGRGTKVTVYCGVVQGGGASNTVTYENYYGSTTVSADNAYTYLSQLIEEGAPRAFARGRGVAYGTAAYSWLETALTSAQTHLSNNELTASAGDSVRQAAAANMLSDGLATATASSGDSALTSSVAFAQAVKGQESSWVMSAQIFNDISGYIFSLLQSLMIGLLPLILVAAFVPGTKFKILVSVVQIFLWLALWQPTFAILNFIITEYAQGPFGGAISDSNYTMMTAPIVSETTNRFIAAAGFMGASIPMITWGIVKGGIGLTSFVSGAMGGSFASAAANMAATGNVSLGNQSYDNFSSSNFNAVPTYAVGNGKSSVQIGDTASTVTADEGGTVYSNAGMVMAKSEFKNAASSANELAKANVSASESAVQKTSSSGAQTALSSIQNISSQGQEGTDHREGTQLQETSTESSSLKDVTSALETLTEGQTDEEARSTLSTLDASLSANVDSSALTKLMSAGISKFSKQKFGTPGGGDSKGKGMFGAGAGVKNQAADSAKSSTSTKDERQRSDQQTKTNDYSNGASVTESEAAQSLLSFATAYSKTTGATDQKTTSELQAASDKISSAEQWNASSKEALQTTESVGMKEGFDDINDVKQWVSAQRGALEQFRNDGKSFGGESALQADFDRSTGALEAKVGSEGASIQETAADSGSDAPANEDATKQAASDGLANTEQKTTESQGDTAAAGEARKETVAAAKNGVGEELKERRGAVADMAKLAREGSDGKLAESMLDFSSQFDKAGGELLTAIGVATGVKAGANFVKSAAEQKALTKVADQVDKHGVKSLGQKGKGIWDTAKATLLSKSDTMKRFSSAVDKMGVDKFTNFVEHQGAAHLAEKFGASAAGKFATKMAVSAGASGTGVGAVVGVPMAAWTAYDGYEMVQDLSYAAEQFSNNEEITGAPEGATGIAINDTVAQQAYQDVKNGYGGSGDGGGNSSPFATDGGTGMVMNTDRAPDRSQEDARRIIDNMDDTKAQMYASGNLGSNSTLLNRAEGDSTALQEIMSGRMTEDQAVNNLGVNRAELANLSIPLR